MTLQSKKELGFGDPLPRQLDNLLIAVLRVIKDSLGIDRDDDREIEVNALGKTVNLYTFGRFQDLQVQVIEQFGQYRLLCNYRCVEDQHEFMVMQTTDSFVLHFQREASDGPTYGTCTMKITPNCFIAMTAKILSVIT